MPDTVCSGLPLGILFTLRTFSRPTDNHTYLLQLQQGYVIISAVHRYGNQGGRAYVTWPRGCGVGA